MSRQPLRLASDEDNQTYRKWMRIFALTYCSIFLLAVGTASLRVHQNSNIANTAVQTYAVANLNQF